ncbi:MAG: universal stress protein [Candidatus Methanomethylophilaceae archaeon]|jgi:nucleotide-binding universal stress UspA family protein
MMVFEKILVPTDGSKYTEAAMRAAMELAKLSNGVVTALYVVDQTIFRNIPMDTAIMNVYEILESEGKDALSFAEELGKEYGVEVIPDLAEGIPIKVILEKSEDHDIIVMGTLGRSGLSKLLMGSVADKVVKASKRPVMVVRSPEADIK